MSTRNHIPKTVEASLDARLSPFRGVNSTALEDLDVEVAPQVSPRNERHLRLGLINDLKLMFAALGAGGSVVPLGDNARTAHLLAQYAESLRRH
jgi:hypothetical protein